MRRVGSARRPLVFGGMRDFAVDGHRLAGPRRPPFPADEHLELALEHLEHLDGVGVKVRRGRPCAWEEAERHDERPIGRLGPLDDAVLAAVVGRAPRLVEGDNLERLTGPRVGHAGRAGRPGINACVEGPAELHPGVYGLGSKIVNWYLVEEAGSLTAVDAGLPAFADSLDADLDRLGLTASDIEAVVLTHSDGDHIGIARDLEARGARVLIHHLDQETLPKGGPRSGDRGPRHLLPNLWRPPILRILGHNLRRGGAKPPKVKDPEAFSSGEVLEVPGRPRVVHTPGHTPGHCALLFESRGMLITGDALCNHELITKGRGPRLMPSFLNVDNGAARDSLATLEEAEADLLLFGHGDPWRGEARSAIEAARAADRS